MPLSVPAWALLTTRLYCIRHDHADAWQSDEFEEVEVYYPDEDRWVCGMAPKWARTEEEDQDVEMK